MPLLEDIGSRIGPHQMAFQRERISFHCEGRVTQMFSPRYDNIFRNIEGSSLQTSAVACTVGSDPPLIDGITGILNCVGDSALF